MGGRAALGYGTRRLVSPHGAARASRCRNTTRGRGAKTRPRLPRSGSPRATEAAAAAAIAAAADYITHNPLRRTLPPSSAHAPHGPVPAARRAPAGCGVSASGAPRSGPCGWRPSLVPPPYCLCEAGGRAASGRPRQVPAGRGGSGTLPGASWRVVGGGGDGGGETRRYRVSCAALPLLFSPPPPAPLRVRCGLRGRGRPSGELGCGGGGGVPATLKGNGRRRGGTGGPGAVGKGRARRLLPAEGASVPPGWGGAGQGAAGEAASAALRLVWGRPLPPATQEGQGPTEG